MTANVLVVFIGILYSGKAQDILTMTRGRVKASVQNGLKGRLKWKTLGAFTPHSWPIRLDLKPKLHWP